MVEASSFFRKLYVLNNSFIITILFLTFQQVPVVNGCDVAGTVAAVGSSVNNFKVGDRIYYHGNVFSPHGGFAEYSVSDAIATIHLPNTVKFEEAAAIPCAAWTAYVALYDKLKIQHGGIESVLITAGAGGVGGFAIQLCKLNGIKNIVTTCSKSNFDLVKSLGAHHAIDYNSEDIAVRVKELTNGLGVDAWIDVVGTESCDYALNNQLVAFSGHLVVIQDNPTLPRTDLGSRQTSIHNIALGAAHRAGPKAQSHLAEIGKVMIDLVAQKKIDPMVSEIIKLEDIPEFLEKSKTRHLRGKVVAKLD